MLHGRIKAREESCVCVCVQVTWGGARGWIWGKRIKKEESCVGSMPVELSELLCGGLCNGPCVGLCGHCAPELLC